MKKLKKSRGLRNVRKNKKSFLKLKRIAKKRKLVKNHNR
jgi:hypothetical protein